MPLNDPNELMTGAFMPRSIVESLDLRALKYGISRSDLIRQIISEWADEQNKHCTDVEIQMELAVGYVKELESFLGMVQKDDWEDVTTHYITGIEDKLLKRKLMETTINRIVTEVKRLAKNKLNSASEKTLPKRTTACKRT